MLVVASGNPGKLREFAALLQPLGYAVHGQAEFGVPEVAETGTTFVENAIIKARHAARLCALPAIADDSGLIVDALDGAPGVRSARYAGVGASDEENLRLLLDNMRGIPDARRGASFVCVMVYMRDPHDACPRVGEGLWHGRITHAPRGDGGFGYDPVFFVEERGCTSAELAPADKNSISHRATAMRALLAHLEAS